MVCPASHKSIVSRGTQGHQLEPHPFCVRDCHPLWSTVPSCSTRVRFGNLLADLQLCLSSLTTPTSYKLAGHLTILVWAAPLSLATTQGMISFPRGTKMFQFPQFPPPGLCVQPGVPRFRLGGFPHSGISGSFACTRAPQSFSQCATPFIGF